MGGYVNPYRFTGRRYDEESGLYYYRARMYAPAIGRFLQPDPIGYADSMNLYQYCGNNPVNWVDPWGLDSVAIYNSTEEPWTPWYMVFLLADSRHHKMGAMPYKHAIPVTGMQDAIRKLQKLKQQGVEITDLFIIDHGNVGTQSVGGEDIKVESAGWKKLSNLVQPDGSIHLKGCSVAKGKKGKKYLQDLANNAGRPVVGGDRDGFSFPYLIPGNFSLGIRHWAYPPGYKLPREPRHVSGKEISQWYGRSMSSFK